MGTRTAREVAVAADESNTTELTHGHYDATSAHFHLFTQRHGDRGSEAHTVPVW